MKKTLTFIVIIVIIIVGIVVYKNSSTSAVDQGAIDAANNYNGSTTPSAPVIENTKVSSKTSSYQNAELGFSVKYPTAWEADNTDSGVTFIIPLDKTQVGTVAKLEADITTEPGKCAFPPVTTVQDRGTLTVGASTLNMISITNTVKDLTYFDRIYTLQKGNVCYLFTLSTIVIAPSSKGLTGSSIVQAQNNNKALIASTDSDFKAMVKTFAFIATPAGQDETTIAPKK